METPAPPPAARGPSSRVPLLIGGAVALLCLLAAAAFAVLSLRRDQRSAVVDSVTWERAIQIEALGPVAHSDWEDQVTSDARDQSCRLAYRTTQDDPAPLATEVCGTPYTVETGGGYGEVIQDCVYQVYDQMCTYTVDEWAVVETLRRSGDDLRPAWPEVHLTSGQQEGDRTETYGVVLIGDGDSYNYSPATASDFTAFGIGSQWTIVVNGLGAIVIVEPAP